MCACVGVNVSACMCLIAAASSQNLLSGRRTFTTPLRGVAQARPQPGKHINVEESRKKEEKVGTTLGSNSQQVQKPRKKVDYCHRQTQFFSRRRLRYNGVLFTRTPVPGPPSRMSEGVMVVMSVRAYRISPPVGHPA